MFEAAQARGDEDLLVTAHSAAQVSHFWSGSLVESKWHAEQIFARFEVNRYARLGAATHNNPKTTAGVLLGQALWMLGYPDRALALWRETLDFAAQFSHPFDSCFAWAMGGYLVAYRRETEAITEAASTAYRISGEIGIPFMNLIVTPPVEAFGQFESCRYERVCALLEQAWTLWRAVRGRSNIPNWCCIWARSKAMLGDMQGAQEIVAMGLEQIRTPGWGERTHLAELLRVEGELHLMRDDVDRAIVSFEESLAWAREQQAKSWELRTAMSYARLMQSQGRRAEAVDLLRPIYDWFTEGRDTRDHIEARALLEDLERPQAVP
jgi:tetratricopeptide (TPR) repeat protein